MIQNLDAHLNNCRHNVTTCVTSFLLFRKENYLFKKMVLTTAGLLKIRSSLYIAQSQIVLSRKLWL